MKPSTFNDAIEQALATHLATQTKSKLLASLASTTGFNRSNLPSAKHYYLNMVGLRLRGQGVWRSVLCPFHGDTNPSLSINTKTGAFRCHACGAAGGDVLDFEMKLSGTSFKDAAMSLGAWNT